MRYSHQELGFGWGLQTNALSPNLHTTVMDCQLILLQLGTVVGVQEAKGTIVSSWKCHQQALILQNGATIHALLQEDLYANLTCNCSNELKIIKPISRMHTTNIF